MSNDQHRHDRRTDDPHAHDRRTTAVPGHGQRDGGPDGPATPADLFARLARLGIEVAVHHHAPLHTVADSQALRGTIPGGHCKNLFLRNKKGIMWLVVAQEDRAVDLKDLGGRLGAGRLSFGSAERLMTHLGVRPGAVSPFALINDRAAAVNVVLDAAMLEHDRLNYHPLVNDQTVTIGTPDLLTFIAACGHRPVRVTL